MSSRSRWIDSIPDEKVHELETQRALESYSTIWTPSKRECIFETTVPVRKYDVKFEAFVNLKYENDIDLFDLRVSSPAMNSMVRSILKSLDCQNDPHLSIELEKPFPGPIDMVQREVISGLAIEDKDADEILKILIESDEPKIAVLCLAQQFLRVLGNNFKQNLDLRRFIVTVSLEIAQNFKTTESRTRDHNESLENKVRCFNMYAHAVSIRIAHQNPLDYSAWHMAAVILHEKI